MRLLGARIGASAALAAFAASAVAHEGATGVVKQRMDQMKEMGQAARRINARLKDGRDPAGIQADAERIRSGAARMPPLFPAGTGGGHSEAKASVWQRWPEFVQAAKALEREAEKLRDIAGASAMPEVAKQFRSMSGTCSACHDPFRAKP